MRPSGPDQQGQAPMAGRLQSTVGPLHSTNRPAGKRPGCYWGVETLEKLGANPRSSPSPATVHRVRPQGGNIYCWVSCRRRLGAVTLRNNFLVTHRNCGGCCKFGSGRRARGAHGPSFVLRTVLRFGSQTRQDRTASAMASLPRVLDGTATSAAKPRESRHSSPRWRPRRKKSPGPRHAAVQSRRQHAILHQDSTSM